MEMWYEKLYDIIVTVESETNIIEEKESIKIMELFENNGYVVDSVNVEETKIMSQKEIDDILIKLKGWFMIKILSIILGIVVFVEFIIIVFSYIKEYIMNKEDKINTEI